MAFQSYRTNFKGMLNNIPVEQLRTLDYNKSTLEERMKYIREKHEKIKPFYDKYIFTSNDKDAPNLGITYDEEELAEYYKVNLNTKDELSSDINIFKYCENDATYLLNSLDIPRDKQQQYRFLSEEDFKKILKKESCLNTIINDDEPMAILKRSKKNDYINMEHKITKEDLEDEECGSVLREYEKARVYLKEEMEKCKNKQSDVSLYKIKEQLKTIKDDMILSKVQLKGIRGPAKKLGDEYPKGDFDKIDYTNPKHIGLILKFVKFGELHPDSELSHIAYDIEIVIKDLYNNGIFDDLDMEIIECYNSGYSNVHIGKEVNRHERTIRQRIEKIFKKIAEYFETKDTLYNIKNMISK